MLKTIAKSSNKKLGHCAATYRAGLEDVYSTCPSSCPMKPDRYPGTNHIDTEYLQAVLDAVPSEGVSWTYTHFSKNLIPLPQHGKTTINISTDSVEEAIASISEGRPTVVVRPAEYESKVDYHQGTRLVRCPAEYSDITCSSCGSGQPLCARQDRDYIVKFTAHGAQKKVIAIRQEVPDTKGGCYGNGGPVRLQWQKTIGDTDNDSATLLSFVRGLPRGTILRHHVVGDLGL